MSDQQGLREEGDILIEETIFLNAAYIHLNTKCMYSMCVCTMHVLHLCVRKLGQDENLAPEHVSESSAVS